MTAPKRVSARVLRRRKVSREIPPESFGFEAAFSLDILFYEQMGAAVPVAVKDRRYSF